MEIGDLVLADLVLANIMSEEEGFHMGKCIPAVITGIEGETVTVVAYSISPEIIVKKEQILKFDEEILKSHIEQQIDYIYDRLYI